MSVFIEAAVRVVLIFAFLLVTVLLLIWVERKFVSDLQNRVGPDRAGPWGILQSLADGVKSFFKESIRPTKAEFWIYAAAPIAALIPALLIFMVIPVGAPITIGGTEYQLVGADLNIGLLYVLALSSMAVYAVALAGWSSGSKYPLLGSVRASAQMISYEAAMGLALIPVVLFAGTTSIVGIVEAQQGSHSGASSRRGTSCCSRRSSSSSSPGSPRPTGHRSTSSRPNPRSSVAITRSTPDSGSPSSSSPSTSTSSTSRRSPRSCSSADGRDPSSVPRWLEAILPIFWFLVKTWAIVLLFVWVRATLPRMRYDQLMSFGWKRLIPVSLVWIVLVAVSVAVRDFGLPWS